MCRNLLVLMTAVFISAAGTEGTWVFASGAAPVRRVVGSSADAEVVSVEACSELHFTEAEARTQAKHRFEDALLDVITARTDCRVAGSQLLSHRARLLYTSGATPEESTEQVAKPYGTMYRHRIRASFSQSAMTRWVNEVAREQQQRRRFQSTAGVVTVLGWICGVAVFIRLDRWTRGYCRPLIAVTTVVALLCATVMAWTTLLT